MSDLFTLVPKNIIDGYSMDFQRGSVRLVTFVAVGGLNVEHPWHIHAPRITADVSRCIYASIYKPMSTENMVVTARLVLMMLQDVGVLSDITFQKQGYVAHQNQTWFEDHRTELEDPDPRRRLSIVNYEAETSIWRTPEEEVVDDEAGG